MSIYRNELKRSLCSKWMITALTISSLIGVLAFLYTLKCKNEYVEMLSIMGKSEAQYITNETAFTKWMFFDDSNIFKYVLIFIMPILVVLPHGASFHYDCKSGYIKHMVTRTVQKSYYRAKYTANFIASGLVFIAPAIINFIMVSWIYPMHKPSPFVARLREPFLFCDVFYEAPLIYLIICILYYFIVAGLLASIAILVSKYIQNYFSIIITPFVLAYIAKYIDILIMDRSCFWLISTINGKGTRELLPFYIIMYALIFVITYFPFVHIRNEVV